MKLGAIGKRRGWVAAVLAFLWPAIGYQYAGRGRFGLALMLLYPGLEASLLLAAPVLIPVPVANLLVPLATVLVLRFLLARGAASAAAAFPQGERVPIYGRWYACLVALLLLHLPMTLWAMGFRTAVVQAFRIPSTSMSPTIELGDCLLSAKWAYGWRDPVFGRVLYGARGPVRGDIVVFPYPINPSKLYLKRCIGLPGETVEVRGQQVLIDGTPLDESYAKYLEPIDTAGLRLGSNWGPALVPPGSYFLLGDNRDRSADSRHFGFVKQSDILGRAALIYWSRDEEGTIRWSRLGQRL